MTDKELGTAAGDIFAKAFTLGYETGREYVPVGGRVLTAELVEDVEALVATANPYSAPAARLRALFPAAEPAAEVKPVKFRKMTPKYATANFGFPDVTVDPFTPFTRWAYKDSDGDKWAWNGDQWELHIVPPSPAEPAEEETKAEGHDPDALAKRLAWIWHDGWDACGERERGYLRRAAEMAHSHYASSPVVPAPTETEGGVIEVPDGRGIEVGEALKQIAAAQMAEVARKAETGPWQTWQEVPDGIPYRAKRYPSGLHYVNRNGVRFLADGPKSISRTMQSHAPFVAAAEEG